MCAAVVSCRPSEMKKNSRPNKAPANRPPRQVAPTWFQPPFQQISSPTSNADIPERPAACITGAISAAAHLIITC
ncbi:hypothetical protein D3C78_1406890 [compost metagenome]